MFLRLTEAISLHRKGLLHGIEFFIFPADLNPWVFSTDFIHEAKNSRRTKVASLESAISANAC
ncbi:hypothetical protein SAMD00079811_59250 [Scytonema sp. HK-05]|nr:hypothetical protein NIES2130_32920 [Scytonema sp. HK-05]BAY48304.1 hypothetical protein SAMD00079811_59250 [Scytonema sp. HK-05]